MSESYQKKLHYGIHREYPLFSQSLHMSTPYVWTETHWLNTQLLVLRPVWEAYWEKKTTDTHGSTNIPQGQLEFTDRAMFAFRGRALGKLGYQAILQPADTDGHASYVLVISYAERV